MFPEPSTAPQNESDGQETATSRLTPATFLNLHPPAAGAEEVSTFPAESTATHVDSEEHEIPATCAESTFRTVQAGAPPVGSLELTMSPNGPTATHSDSDGQETPCIVGPTWVNFQAAAPAVGLVEVITSPASTATHSFVEGHETSVRRLCRLIPDSVRTFHDGVAALGFREVAILSKPTATQNEVDGHEMAPNWRAPRTFVIDHAIGPPFGSVDV
jgi:hypothetical protein